jgi:hypothetical protein
MSIFRYERLQDVQSISFLPKTFPIAPSAFEFWLDQAQGAVIGRSGGTNVAIALNLPSIVTPVTATNPSSVATLMAQTLPAGFMNNVGRTLNVWGAGVYTTAAGQTPTVNVAIQLGGTTIATWTTGATTASATNMPWNFEVDIITQAAGTAGAVEAHGILDLTLGTTAGAASATYNDTNSAVIGSLNLNSQMNLAVVVTMSSSNAGNSVSQRLLSTALAW